MHPFIKALIALTIRVTRNVVSAVMTERMVLWTLARYAKSTETKVDDYAVELIAAGLSNDTARIEKAVQALTELYLVQRNGK